MLENVLPVFPFRSFIASHLTFKSLSHFELSSCMMWKNVLKFIDLHEDSSFPSTTCCRLSFLHYLFFPPLLQFTWPSVWAFISGCSIVFHWSISVFVPTLCYSYYCSLWYYPKSGRVMLPASFFILRIDLAILYLFWFHINFRIICYNSVKNIMGDLVGIFKNL